MQPNAITLSLVLLLPLETPASEPTVAEETPASEPTVAEETTEPSVAEATLALPELYERVAPAVVRVLTPDGHGSGFLIGDGTQVVTAWHVVSSPGDIYIEAIDGQRHPARLVSRHAKRDVAVLSIEAPLSIAGASVAPLSIAPATPPVGTSVAAVGHPNATAAPVTEGPLIGLLTWSLSEGIVSKVGEDTVQMTAAVDSGSSGGPLVDREGRVIGVVTLRLRTHGGAARVENLQALLDDAPAVPRGPSVKPALLLSLGYSLLPGGDERLKNNFGFSAGAEFVFDQKLAVGVHGAVDVLVNKEAKAAGRRAQRFSLYGTVGPRFEAPFQPGRKVRFAVHPYGMFGVGVRRTGAFEQRLQFDDPACDPSSTDCAYTSSEETLWGPRSVGPRFGGGVRFELGRGFIDWNLSTNPLAPAEDTRMMIGAGFRF